MAMATAGKGGGGFDVDSVLNFEKRSGIKDGEIENFITKVDAVNAAIQAMKASYADEDTSRNRLLIDERL